MLLHLGWTSCAVDPKNIRVHGTDGSQGCSYFRTHQHPSSGFHRDLNLNRDWATLGEHGPSTANHCRLDLQEIHAGFNEE